MAESLTFEKFLESNKLNSEIVDLLKIAYKIGIEDGCKKQQKENYEEWNQK